MLVTSVGIDGCTWHSAAACVAALRRPAFPDTHDMDVDSSQPSSAANNPLLEQRQPAPASSRQHGISTWFVEAQPSRNSCHCHAQACREPIEYQSLRARSAANNSRPYWFHLGCIEGGLGACDSVQGLQSLPPESQDEVRQFCDQPGGVSRAQYVQDVQQAKRTKLTADLDPAADLGRNSVDPLPEDSHSYEDRSSEPTLQNLEWWDGISYDSLSEWVPTVGKVPADLHHGLALLRGAICREMRLARESGNQVWRGSCR